MHAWTITSGVNIFSTHIHTDDDLTKTQDILSESTKILKERFDFYFSTVKIEKECLEMD